MGYLWYEAWKSNKVVITIGGEFVLLIKYFLIEKNTSLLTFHGSFDYLEGIALSLFSDNHFWPEN